MTQVPPLRHTTTPLQVLLGVTAEFWQRSPENPGLHVHVKLLEARPRGLLVQVPP